MRRLIVEADGGSRGNPGVAGYGALVRDEDESTLLAERAAPLGKASNNVAEYSGLIAGLEAAAEVDPAADVEVRMDSKLVVEQMAGRWKIKHEDMRRLALEARDLVAQRRTAGGTVTYTWVPRDQNKAADRLSNDGMDGRTISRLLNAPSGDASARAETDAETDDEADADVDDDAIAQPKVVDAAAVAVAGPASVAQAGPSGRRRIERSASSTSVTSDAPGASGASADLGQPARIVLVRHGATEATHAGLLDGRGGADTPLTTQGQRQAHAAAAAVRTLIGTGPLLVVTSSLARARQTGSAIASTLGVIPQVDGAWDEQHFGDWEGCTVAGVCAANADDFARLRTEDDFARPGGESRADLFARVLPAFEALTIRAREEQVSVVVVSHRAAILAVLSDALGMTSPWALSILPGSLTGLRRWGDGGVCVDFVNDTTHLRR